MNALPTSLLQRLLERPAPFALLYRPESNGPGLLDVIRGEALELHGLADLPLDEPGPGLPRHDLLALIPYRQIAERGFEALDDGTPLLALKVLEQELVLLAQKSDVAEELDRLATHVGEVRRVLKAGGAAGRRLDFLMQELNREANTLGSKAFDPRSTQAAVNLKVLIEQMREQVQNIE